MLYRSSRRFLSKSTKCLFADCAPLSSGINEAFCVELTGIWLAGGLNLEIIVMNKYA